MSFPYSPQCFPDFPPISLTKVELLHQQSAQIKELKRKHEAAQLTVTENGGADGDDIEEDEDEDEDGDAAAGGLFKALKEVCYLRGSIDRGPL